MIHGRINIYESFFIYRWFVIRWQTLTAINNVWPFEILIGERCNGDT